jgi:PDZ domain/Aspartyl protease
MPSEQARNTRVPLTAPPRRQSQSSRCRGHVLALLALWPVLASQAFAQPAGGQTIAPAPSGKPAQPAPAAKPEQPGPKAVVRFEMLPSNHMLVEAQINDKGPFHLIFDLGAPVTLLNNRASEAAAVVKPDAPRSFLFGMRGEAEIKRLKVGDLTADKLPVIVLDHPVLSALEEATGRRIDGIMGFTFFARFKTTIDYHAREMTFEPISYQMRDLLKDLPERLMAPKVAQRRVVAPSGLWGLELGDTIATPDAQGVAIKQVLEGSPAYRAGLKAGDVLGTIDGRWITSRADVYHAAAKAAPGAVVAVVISRDGKELTVRLKPADGI